MTTRKSIDPSPELSTLVPGEVCVEFRGVAKSFGGVFACRGLSFAVRRGSIHAIVGENGAGKSTAMKILYGMIGADAGEIWVDGRQVGWSSPQEAIRAGIGMVHQHFMLAAPYSALENIILGEEPSRWGIIDFAKARRKLDSISSGYGLKADWDIEVSRLGVGIRQRIEIIKILYREASILIFDEPTAVLTPFEAAELFIQLRRLKAEGKTILIITHKLREVLELADEVTVFRQGEVVGHRLTSETDQDELANLMVGRKVNLRIEAPRSAPSPGAAVLEVQGLSLWSEKKARLSGVDLTVHAGEIIGIAGVEGNGQSELLSLLSRPKDFKKAHRSGIVRVLGREISSDTEAERIRDLGVGVIPEDRHHEGLLMDRPMIESFLLGRQGERPLSRLGILNAPEIRASYEASVREYDVRPRQGALEARYFSGGNQQKVIIARELGLRSGKWPALVIAAQPTRGVDVGAIEMIHARLLRARGEGAGVLLVSSELEEILALSDRILVMYEGKIVGTFDRGETGFDEVAIGRQMGGGGAS